MPHKRMKSNQIFCVFQTFWGKQGMLRVITYTNKHNTPKGHVALWDCNHFHQAKDWIAGKTLISVEFWESPGECTVHSSEFRVHSSQFTVQHGGNIFVSEMSQIDRKLDTFCTFKDHLI